MKKIALLGLVTLSFSSHAVENLAMLDLDEVVVTASRTPQSTKTVTGDVTVIDREEIK